MPEPHKRPYRHPKDITAYRVKNWREYDQALRHRGDITLSMRQDAIGAWTPPQTGKQGSQPVYTDLAIETARTFRLLFRLPLRQTEGLLSSIVTLMGLSLPCPDHTTLSRRQPTVAMRQQVERAPQGPLALIVDSSGLQVCGQGEWHTQKHGEETHKCWKKLHIGVDAQGHIVASAVAACSGARVIIPPRKDAVLSPTGTISPTQRDQHLLAIERAGRCTWKRTSGYDAQSHAEHAFSRCRRTFGGG